MNDAPATATAAGPVTARPLVGIGQVRHARLRPAGNAFAYPTWFVLLPMRALRERPEPALPRNARGWVSFHDRDHGDGGEDALAWFEALLRAEGVHDADGEVWLHTYPRVLGFVFKPVSFWYAHRRDGSLAAVVAEVNNTFGERHCYLLTGSDLAWGRELRARKVFHVSPFCELSGRYRFRFLRSQAPAPEEVLVRIDHDDESGPLLRTSVGGQLEPVTRASLRRVLLEHPAMTLMIVARIHWQALRLWCKRVRFHAKPAPPDRFVSR